MKRRTINIKVYDNDVDYDGHMEIRTKTVRDAIGTYSELTLTVGDTSLAFTPREFQELRELMDEVTNVED